MATQDKVASRYARAIFEAQKNKTLAEKTLTELEQFYKCLEKNTELSAVLTSPSFTSKERESVCVEVLSRLEASDGARRVILVLLEQKRIPALRTILEKLNQLILESSGVVPIHVEAAADLNADERSTIERRFQGVLGKGVKATYRIDPKLIGGVKVKACGKTYDGSVLGWLSHFEEQLVGGTL